MDSARSTVFGKIQSIEPENASKIMGYVLIQDPDEEEMMRLAFGHESVLQKMIQQAKIYLGISSNSSSSSSFSHIIKSNSNSNSNPNSSSSSLSYAAAVLNNGHSGTSGDGFSSGESLLASSNKLEYTKTEDLFDPGFEMAVNGNPNSFHRRSISLTDACYGGGFEDGGGSGFGGFRPCMYYARGFCKNGSSCGFKHGGFGDSGDISAIVGSPSNSDAFEQSQEIFRSRALAASQLMGGGLYPFSPRSNAPSTLMIGDEFHKLGRSRSERNNFSGLGLDVMDPISRQIYLTFPAESTFLEEDVSNYFSIYGPVQDVRIPYQAKRMFGFVTFVYPETVKIVLAKGNPHFVCDSRVLVKPYKEKGKVDKKQYQHQQLDFERVELLGCSSPRDPCEIPVGPRMFYNPQELMLRRKLENQAELQQAIELQSRRMLSLQLQDIQNHQYKQSLSAFNPISSRTHMDHNLIPSDGASASHEIQQDNNISPDSATNIPNGEEGEESFKFSDTDINESRLERIFLPDSLFS